MADRDEEARGGWGEEGTLYCERHTAESPVFRGSTRRDVATSSRRASRWCSALPSINLVSFHSFIVSL